MSILDDVVLDPAECGLLVIDMQNGFCHPDGSRGKAFGADSVYKPEAIIPDVVRLMRMCRDLGIRRWFTRQVYYTVDESRAKRRIPSHLERRGLKLELTRRGTWDADLHGDIAAEVEPEDEIIVKHRASAFYNTSLEPELRMLGIQVLIIAGTTTSFCVDSTVRDAYARDFDVLVPAECVADTEDEAQEAVLHGINRFHGVVTSIEEIAGLFGSGAAAKAG